ncbi:nickel-dependent hydrogenase large subunit [Aquabacterium sp.]|uniref:nickel-dependent hydrogenase large subunit n=1 Tax=Aquabacterium sp. TaxID=1872578 RepID=UPI003785164E
MDSVPPTRLVVGPFNRVEGDLEVRLTLHEGQVAEAQVSAPMYRGFENLLQGREPHDALVIVPRICGICSVSQSVAAARALADAAGIEAPANGRIATDLMLATENLADHLTHFYLFFMPDFAREVYAGQPWFGEACRRFEAGRGDGGKAVLIMQRQRWFHRRIMAVNGRHQSTKAARRVQQRRGDRSGAPAPAGAGARVPGLPRTPHLRRAAGRRGGVGR